MIKLLKNADVYAPEHLGIRDVLVAEDKIERVAPAIEGWDGLEGVEVIDLRGQRLAPGLIDLHVHITGGGGEQGPASRVPEISLSELTLNGVTTAVGLLGTDGVTRSLENLLAKCNALNDEGITCYMTTGSYQFPTQTLTGTVVRDISLISPCVGVKVAVSDHRSSNLTQDELIRLASDARLGGLISGKAGIVIMHMGGGQCKMDKILYAARNTDIPAKTFLPTHVGRTAELLGQAIELTKLGGFADITASEHPAPGRSAASHIARCIREGADMDRVTLSSDACGSQPKFDASGACIGLTYTSPKILMGELRSCVRDEGIPLETALKVLTSNPALALGLAGVKGCVRPGADADLVVLDEQLEVRGVFARGKTAVWDKQPVMKGTFEA